MKQFQADYSPLVDNRPELGQVAILPWDSEIFGFPVAEYVPGDLDISREYRQDIADCFGRWSRVQQIELISSSVPAHNVTGLSLLTDLGFRIVDFSVLATLPRLQKVLLPANSANVRRLDSSDQDDVDRIAATAFRFGRYHQDPWFPTWLANRRYWYWIGQASRRPAGGELVFVIGEPGQVKGFLHVVRDEQLADLRLGAIDQESGDGFTGVSLYAGVLSCLRERGVRRVTAKVSAANTSVLNLLSHLGFRFSDPRYTGHWHAPNAVHLIAPLQLDDRLKGAENDR